MFVRRKVNKSGSVSIQVIDKSFGYKVIKTIGSATKADEIKFLIARAKEFIQTSDGSQTELFHAKINERGNSD